MTQTYTRPQSDDDPHDEYTDAQIIPFPRTPDQDQDTPDTPPAPAPLALRAPAHRRVAAGVRGAATHRYTRFALRQGAHVVAGGHVVAKRTWDSRTTARHERMMRAAELKGDHQAAREWEERASVFKRERHQRHMELLAAPYHLVKATVFGSGLTFGGLIALGIMLAIVNKNIHEVFRPLLDVLHAVEWLWWLGSILWLPTALAMPIGALAWLWTNGRARGQVPNWLMPEGKRPDSEMVTPSIVVKALRDLGVGKLTAGIKEMADGAASMLGPITLAGCGVEVDVTLPSGVSTADIQTRRKRLAENLGRHEHELFITIPAAARTVHLWIADSGALDEPIGPSPLVVDETATADYYTGRAPWGQTLRGDAALISLFQRMLLITGLSNQGKTASLRALVLWLALDVTVEFRLADLKGVGDWKCMDGIATTLIEGPTDTHVIETTEMLEGGVDEMERRISALNASGSPDGVTREMARRPGSGFHPLILIVDEAQVAYMCPVTDEQKRPYGGQKATSRYLTAVRKIHNQGRAVNVLLWEGTQDPTNQNLPKLSREGNHTRVALAVGTEEQSRMALGDAAVNGGAAPHKLRQGLDKGTVVVASDGIDRAPGETSVTVRTHYISGEQALALGERVKALRAKAKRGRQREAARAERDPLTDVLTVLGDSARLQTNEVIRRLIALDSDAYDGLTNQRLTETLTAAGAEPHKSHGVMVVSRARVQEAIAEREDETGAGENPAS